MTYLSALCSCNVHDISCGNGEFCISRYFEARNPNVRRGTYALERTVVAIHNTENEHASKPKYGFWFPLSLTLYGVITSLLVAFDQRFASILRVSCQLCNSRILLLIPGLPMNRRYSNEKSSHAYLIQLRVLHFPNCPGVLAIGYKLLFNFAKFAVRNS